MDEVNIINNNYVNALLTKVRDNGTSTPDIQKCLTDLGEYIATEIVSKELTNPSSVFTPMQKEFNGFSLSAKPVVIVSTKDDYQYFLKGISSKISNPITGFINFEGQRGKATYDSAIRSLELPEIPKGKAIDAVIVAKSVLATGCTAVTLAKKAMEKCQANKLIIATCFYSIQGIEELKLELPNCKVYVLGSPDSLNENGYLIPGVGNLDDRQK